MLCRANPRSKPAQRARKTRGCKAQRDVISFTLPLQGAHIIALGIGTAIDATALQHVSSNIQLLADGSNLPTAGFTIDPFANAAAAWSTYASSVCSVRGLGGGGG